jgi:uncharacterized protein involved in response to NO
MSSPVSPSVPRSWRGHPLWLVGFRPFFLLACVAGALLPIAWVLVLNGKLTLPSELSPMAWHAHEMFYGFGLAVLGGFLLTATKNWVQVRGHYGHTLQVLVAAWLLERAGMWFGGGWPVALQVLSQHLFGVLLVAAVSFTLLRHRKTDTYPDNPLFLIALPVFLLDPNHFAEGRDVTLALFRLAFVIMLERTSVPFMKGTFQVVLPRRAWLDLPIKLLALVLVAAAWSPEPLRHALQLALAALFVGRWLTWSPQVAFRRLEVGVMYAGGLLLAAQLVIDVFKAPWVGTVGVHVFTFGTMGLIIPAMLIRIGLGHTGRPIKFELRDRAAVWLMIVALVAPQLLPTAYSSWLWLSASCWSACFVLLGVRLAPLVLNERVDGKEH